MLNVELCGSFFLQYFLRQKQEVKNKRSIHDLTLEDLHEMVLLCAH